MAALKVKADIIASIAASVCWDQLWKPIMLKLETNKLCDYLPLTVTVLESDTAKMWDYFP
jgi:hypothetical protein